MATIDLARRFAEQAVKVEQVLQDEGLKGNASRVVLVLTMANSILGVSQKEVVDAAALPKDVVSKLVRSLVQADLLTQDRDASNPRLKRLVTTEPGRAILSRVRALLRDERPASRKKEPEWVKSSLFDQD